MLTRRCSPSIQHRINPHTPGTVQVVASRMRSPGCPASQGGGRWRTRFSSRRFRAGAKRAYPLPGPPRDEPPPSLILI